MTSPCKSCVGCECIDTSDESSCPSYEQKPKQNSDRKLLELAAKAAGHEFDLTIRPDGLPFYHSERNAFALADGGWFAPLTDDGDAFRLYVKLRLQVIVDGYMAIARTNNPHKHGAQESLSVCQYAATRRAIVRAAAEIGKGME